MDRESDYSIWVDPEFSPEFRSRSNTWPLQQPGPSDNRPPGGPKKSARKNAWGSQSYAELIAMAIGSTKEKRMTLAQIYEYLVGNIVYFHDKGDNNSSAGWKNSIRHNLSLHKCFKRVTNEGSGKSSWWTVDPEAKLEKRTERRRTGSLDTKKYEKKRGAAKKRVEAQRATVRATAKTTSTVCTSISENRDMTISSTTGFYRIPSGYCTTSRTSNPSSSVGSLPSLNSIVNSMPSGGGHQQVYDYYDTYESENLANRFESRVKIETPPCDNIYINRHSPVDQLSSIFTNYNGSPYTPGYNPAEYVRYNPSTTQCTTLSNAMLQTSQPVMSHNMNVLPATSYSLTPLQTVAPQQLNHSASQNSPNGQQIFVDVNSQVQSPFPNRSPCSMSDSGQTQQISPQEQSMLRAALSSNQDGQADVMSNCNSNVITSAPNQIIPSHVTAQYVALNPVPFPNNIDPVPGIECNVQQVIDGLVMDDDALDFEFESTTNFAYVPPRTNNISNNFPATYLVNGYANHESDVNPYNNSGNQYTHH